MTNKQCLPVHVSLPSQSQEITFKRIRFLKKVNTSICIARPMYTIPLTCTCVTETEPPGSYLGHRPACEHSPAQWPNNWHRQRQPAVGLHLCNPSLMDCYSFNRPRRDGWLSWHKVVTRPAISLAQDRESSPARTGGLTTMLRHQLILYFNKTDHVTAGLA